jgi:hypothetical protein
MSTVRSRDVSKGKTEEGELSFHRHAGPPAGTKHWHAPIRGRPKPGMIIDGRTTKMKHASMHILHLDRIQMFKHSVFIL